MGSFICLISRSGWAYVTLSNNNISPSQQIEEAQIVERIPLYEEDFELTKKEEETSIRVEKRWKNSTKKIEIPIKSEEIFVNGKELGYYNENEIVDIFSKIKDKISDVLHHNDDKDDDNSNNRNQNQHKQHHDPNKDLEFKYHKHDFRKKEGAASLSLPSAGNQDKPDSESSLEKTIPLFGEQITINRKIVKVGEVVIRKHQVTEKHEIEVELQREQISTKVPDGFDVQEI
jgi:stress response protein YsnF